MKRVTIYCDGCGHEGTADKIAELARYRARKLGWKHHAAIDLCPNCQTRYQIHRDTGLTERKAQELR